MTKPVLLKTLLMVTLLSSGIYAQEGVYDYESRYFEEGGILTDEIKMLKKTDESYKKAINLLMDKNQMHAYVAKVDPEVKEEDNDPKNTTTVYLPNWDKVIGLFAESCKKTSNPLSAWQGLYILKTKYNNGSPDIFSLFAKTLYEKEKNLCESYMSYGFVFEKGINTKQDLVKSLEIYKEGKSKCKADWEKAIIEGKIWNLSKQLKK